MKNKMLVVCMLGVTFVAQAGVQDAVRKIDEALKSAKSDKVIKLLTSAKQDLVTELTKTQSQTTAASQTALAETGEAQALADKITRSTSAAKTQFANTITAYHSKDADMYTYLNSTLDSLLSALDDYANLKKIAPKFKDSFNLFYNIKRVYNGLNEEPIFYGNDLQLSKSKAGDKMKKVGDLLKNS